MHVLVANPSSDVYGSDLQLLESVSAMTGRGWQVSVVTVDDGPLVPLLVGRGATVQFADFPVLRRASASALGIARLVASAPAAMMRLRALIREHRPTVLYVNTLTLPWWLGASRAAGVPSICHVHEAEVRDSRRTRRVLTAPLVAATLVVANGQPAFDEIVTNVPRLRRRTRLVPNGVAPPPAATFDPAWQPPLRLAVIGRLSPRKAPDVALDALSLLRKTGLDATLDVCGTAFLGYEDYVAGLRQRADSADLRGHVTFSGYVTPVWDALERADIVLATSLGESLGNVVVQAMMARRPVVASEVQGHLDTVDDGVTGLLVPACDPHALADAVTRLVNDRVLAAGLIERGAARAATRYSLDRYGAEIVAVLDEAVARRRARPITSQRR